MMQYLRLPIILTALIVSTQAFAADATGAGSTFVSPVMAKWIDAYKETRQNHRLPAGGLEHRHRLDQEGAVDFGATDRPLDPGDLARLGMIQFPIVIGASSRWSYRGCQTRSDQFHGSGSCRHLSRQTKSWSDPALAAINPDLKLPNAPITVGSSDRRVRNDVQLVKLSVEGQSSMEESGRRRHFGRMAGRARRTRQ